MLGAVPQHLLGGAAADARDAAQAAMGMRGLECSERHPRYAVSHDPHRRGPGLSILAEFIVAPWTTERDHGREREWQIKRLSLATLARRCRP